MQYHNKNIVEKFEDTKGVIDYCKCKDRQYKDQKKTKEGKDKQWSTICNTEK